MRRRQWLFVALPLVLLTVAVLSTRMSGGSSDSASAATPRWAIDMVKDGNTWCNPVTATANHTQAEGDYQVAICLMDTGVVASDFNVQVLYNSSLNSCVNGVQTYPATDANPDFIGDVTNPDGWDCTGGGSNPPACGSGTAFITCHATTDPGALVGTAWPVAVITFHVIAGGDDTLSFGTVAGYDFDRSVDLPFCPPAGEGCVGATDHKSGGEVLPTATSTSLPTATNTPSCGLPGQAACPTSTPTSKPFTKTPSPAPTNTPGAGEQTVPPAPPPPAPPSGGQQPSVTAPNTGTGSGGVTWATTLMWILGSGAALSLLAGGFYLRRVNNR